MAKRLPKDMPYIKTVKSKGRAYEYFDTGVNAFGKRVLRPLPPRSDVAAFGSVYSALLAARTRRANIAAVPTMAQLSREYQLTKKFRNRATNTQDTYLVYLRTIVDQMGNAPVNGVEKRDVQELIDTMDDRPAAAAMTLLVLRNLFALALQKDWCARNPTENIVLPESDDDGDHLPWPDDLLADALEDADVGLSVALLYYTGQRIGDVCKMRWADIEDGAIHVKQQKGGKEVWPPLHEGLLAWLEKTPRIHPTILYGPRGRPRTVAALRKRLQKWAKDRKHEVVPHGLRKNAVHALLEHGCTTVETAAITGQSLTIVEHYAKRINNRRLGRAAMSKWDGTERGNRNPLENN